MSKGHCFSCLCHSETPRCSNSQRIKEWVIPSHLFLPPIILLYRAVSKCVIIIQVFPGGTRIKDPPANTEDAKDMDSISELGRSPGEGNGNPLQSSCLENPMCKKAWQAAVHGVTKSETRLSDWACPCHRYHYSHYKNERKKKEYLEVKSGLPKISQLEWLVELGFKPKTQHGLESRSLAANPAACSSMDGEE